MTLEFDEEKFNKLIAPISAENPTGVYLRNNEILERLKALRGREDDVSENMGIWKTEVEKPQWGEVEKLCEEILMQQSKDLQVCAFYIEALLKKGLADAVFGFKVMDKICEDFWPILFPPLKEDFLEIRIAPIKWMQIKITEVIKRVPITQGSQEFNIMEYERLSQGTNEEKISAKQNFTQELSSKSLEWLENYFSVSEAIKEYCGSIENQFAEIIESSGDDATLTPIEDALKILDNLIAPVIKAKEKEQEAVTPDNEEEEQTEFQDSSADDDDFEFSSTSEASEGDTPRTRTVRHYDENDEDDEFSSNDSFSGQFKRRDEAYRMIALANEFLLRTEPHSPVPYLIRRALNWENKSLFEIYLEIFSSTSKPEEIFTLLGLQGTDMTESGD